MFSVSRIYNYLELKAFILLIVQQNLTKLLQREWNALTRTTPSMRINHLNLKSLLLNVTGLSSRYSNRQGDDLLKHNNKPIKFTPQK
jgi:hypothetical protein